MKTKGHVIRGTDPGSIGEELKLQPGDTLLAINGKTVEDVLDYRLFCQEEYLELLIRSREGEEYICEVEKDAEEDLGLRFENGLMDDYHSCSNQCIFCFIDQMPPGMRKTLYFKDDDSRLSFLQGNYLTLTNLSDADIDRIIRYRLSPINISVHTTDPSLRCRMLNNRFAGSSLSALDKFARAHTEMNGQIVLCPGYNDGAVLEKTIADLSAYLPWMRSVSVVPVGLTDYRQGLTPLTPVTAEKACETIDIVEKWQKKLYAVSGLHFVHASDEFYITAGRPFPEAERYDDYLQLENGVGMVSLIRDEFREALADGTECGGAGEVSIATGLLMAPFMEEMADMVQRKYPQRRIRVYPIRNRFFGEMITVAGLITGQDLSQQLSGQELGSALLLSEDMFRSGETVFLDDVTAAGLQEALQVRVDIVKSNGVSLLQAMLGQNTQNNSCHAPYEPGSTEYEENI